MNTNDTNALATTLYPDRKTALTDNDGTPEVAWLYDGAAYDVADTLDSLDKELGYLVDHLQRQRKALAEYASGKRPIDDRPVNACGIVQGRGLSIDLLASQLCEKAQHANEARRLVVRR